MNIELNEKLVAINLKHLSTIIIRDGFYPVLSV